MGTPEANLAADQHLVWSRYWQDFPCIGGERRRSPDGQHRKYFRKLTEHVPERRERVTHRNCQQGGPIGTVQQIGPRFLGRNTATTLQGAAARNQCGRQHVADKALGDQLPQILDLRREARLRSDHAQHSPCPRERGHLLGFGEAIAERPFAIDVFARADRRLHDLEVRRHFHRHGDDVDVRRRNELGDIGEGSRQPGRHGGRFGAGFAGVGNADDREAVGESAERRNMAACGPTSCPAPRRRYRLLKRCPNMVVWPPSGGRPADKMRQTVALYAKIRYMCERSLRFRTDGRLGRHPAFPGRGANRHAVRCCAQFESGPCDGQPSARRT